MTSAASRSQATTRTGVPARFPLLGSLARVPGHWIDGAPCGDEDVFVVDNPADGSVLARVSEGTSEDACAAVDAAHRAFPGWAGTAPRARSEVLAGTHRLMLEHAEELARLIVAENGKALLDARAEVAYAAEFFRWYAEEGVRTAGDYGPSPGGGTRTIVTRHPVGVAAMVTPWNFPAAMATRKIAPALAAGCTVVLKPAAETPLTALALARLLSQAGAPDGVVNVVSGTAAGDIVTAWLEDDRVRKISFTGSTRVGQVLLRQAADRVLNSSMELGGNAAFVVGPGADMAKAVEGAMVAKYRNGGQACTAANRFYVHASLAEEFTAAFGARIAALRVGDGADPTTDIGPLVSARARNGVRELVDAAVAVGSRVTHEAPLPDGADGYFVAPMLVQDVAADSPLVQSEIFGPVAPVVVWTDDTELLGLVNGTEFGLASYVYGDLAWALKTAEQIEAGMVGVNRGVVSDPSAPFGGMKMSGLGREGGRYGLEEFQETQYLSVDWT